MKYDARSQIPNDPTQDCLQSAHQKKSAFAASARAHILPECIMYA